MAKTQGFTEGCSASPSTADGSAPSDPSKPKCRIYQTSVDEYGRMDSCFNMAALDAMPLPSPNATKRLVTIGGPNLPAVLSATFSPASNLSAVPITCYDWKRMEVFYNAQDPSGETSRSQATVKDRNVNFCGAAKAYYVDGTLSVTNAIGVAPPPPAPVAAGADPRCYVNGVKLGKKYKPAANAAYKDILISYTNDECDQLNGDYMRSDYLNIGLCAIKNFKPKNPDDVGGYYSFFCGKETPAAAASAVPAGEDPRCYANGVKLGVTLRSTNSQYKPDNINGDMMTYTKDECNTLAGKDKYYFDPRDKIGMCFVDNSGKIQYNMLCSPNPKIAKMAKS